jgi:hypothetical protein
MLDYPISRSQLRAMSVLAIEQRRYTIEQLTNTISELVLKTARDGKSKVSFELETHQHDLASEIVGRLKTYYPDSTIYMSMNQEAPTIIVSWI